MIIPEAVLGYGVAFEEVHVFTTDNTQLSKHAIELHSIFQEHFSSVIFSITAAKDVALPNTTESQEYFEEALLQWYIEKAGIETPYICITGGTKTMPATMQQAARFFGAKDIFHLLSDTPPKDNPTTIEAVRQFVKDGKVKFISMGSEAGWESFRSITPRHLFSAAINDDTLNSLWWKQKSELQPVSKNIKYIMQSVQQAATGQEVKDIPFSMLRLLPPEINQWLSQPLDAGKDCMWVKALPKIDLHCHLGGFATSSPLLDLVRSAAQDNSTLKINTPPTPPEDWPLPTAPIPLKDYMHLGDANGSSLLTDPGCLAKQIELLYQHFLEQNIRYAEVRCSPDNYTTTGRPAWLVLQEIINHFQLHMEKTVSEQPEKACHVNLLIIATRKTEGDLSSISRHLALAVTASQFNVTTTRTCTVVGVDLAGYENKDTRPAYFANDFIGVHRSGLAVTAHAGENDDAESIWQAVHQLHARRIGHALHLYQAKDLMRTMADRRIGIEMCPYANYQIKGFYPMPEKENDIYQLRRYMQEGIPVTVNTDNIGISAASLSDNILLLAKMLPGITRLEILELIRNGIETSFSSSLSKKRLLKLMDKQVFESFIKNNLFSI